MIKVSDTNNSYLVRFIYCLIHMSFLYKVLKSESQSYLFNTIPNSNNRQHQTRNSDNIPFFFAKNSFFPSAITEWNKLDCYIRNADSFKVFKKRLLSFIRPVPNSIYNIHNPLGGKYLTRLRIRFSHLKEHKFKHNFQGSIDLKKLYGPFIWMVFSCPRLQPLRGGSLLFTTKFPEIAGTHFINLGRMNN